MSSLKIPNLGESIEVASIIAINISVGASINEGDIVLELETDKATLEIPANHAGKVKKILMKVGDKVSQGQEIAELEAIESKETTAKVEKVTLDKPQELSEKKPQELKGKNQETAASTTETILLPNLGDGITEVAVLKVIQSGKEVQEGDILLEVETDKATLEVPANKEGKVIKVFVQEGSKVKIGDKIILLEVGISGASSVVSPETQQEQTTATTGIQLANAPKKEPIASSETTKILSENKILIPASPIVRRFAREVGLDLTQVTGSLSKGRISIEDIKNHIKQKNQSNVQGNIAMASLPDFQRWGKVTKESLSNIKRATAKNMAGTWQMVPHVTNFHEADITNLEEALKKYKKIAEKKGSKITITILLTKACAVALKKFSHFNASYDANSQQLIIKDYIHLALAVDTPKGLVVPVIRDADQKDIYTIAAEIAAISQKARDGKLTIEEMLGQSFTISSLGGVGDVRHFTPIINYPDVAILGISRSAQRARYIKEQLSARSILPLSLSYDHRVIDGAEATRFMNYLTSILTEPLFPFVG